MDDPVYFWNPTFNPENMIFYTGDKFPRLKGSLLVAGATKKIAQMVVRDDDFVTHGRYDAARAQRALPRYSSKARMGTSMY